VGSDHVFVFLGAEHDVVALSMRDADVAVRTVTRDAALLLGHRTTMIGICALACIGPLLYGYSGRSRPMYSGTMDSGELSLLVWRGLRLA
jgi:hypothetical protein